MALSKVSEQIRDGANVAFAMIWAKISGSAPTVSTSTDITAPVHVLMDTSENFVNPATSDNQTSQITQITAVNTVLGVKGDAKSTATDTTSITAMQVWKQISASVQAIATSVAATLAVKQTRSTTGTQSSVAASASDGTILASNANRLGASIYNDSTVNLYLLFASGTSSTTNYSLILGPGDYIDSIPALYTGVIKGIWASATGSARVTEFT